MLKLSITALVELRGDRYICIVSCTVRRITNIQENHQYPKRTEIQYPESRVIPDLTNDTVLESKIQVQIQSY